MAHKTVAAEYLVHVLTPEKEVALMGAYKLNQPWNIFPAAATIDFHSLSRQRPTDVQQIHASFSCFRHQKGWLQPPLNFLHMLGSLRDTEAEWAYKTTCTNILAQCGECIGMQNFENIKVSRTIIFSVTRELSSSRCSTYTLVEIQPLNCTKVLPKKALEKVLAAPCSQKKRLPVVFSLYTSSCSLSKRGCSFDYIRFCY